MSTPIRSRAIPRRPKRWTKDSGGVEHQKCKDGMDRPEITARVTIHGGRFPPPEQYVHQPEQGEGVVDPKAKRPMQADHPFGGFRRVFQGCVMAPVVKEFKRTHHMHEIKPAADCPEPALRRGVLW